MRSRAEPGYLNLLNQIALTEYRAHEFYLAWARTTPDEELEHVMRVVAVRELEHAAAFQQRITELGFIPSDGPHDFGKQCDEWLQLFSSDASDLQKFHGFGFRETDRLPNDNFHEFFLDTTLDSETGALLGRYIAEERESANMFLKVYARMKAEERTDAAHAEVATELPPVS